MHFKKIHIIINPASGKEEPILSYLCKFFAGSDIAWRAIVTHKPGEAYSIAKGLIGKTDLVAVYGGDGSVTEVARALYLSETAMTIIPGGTANVMAKELNIPMDTKEALRLLLSKESIIEEIDMGLVNDYPFLLRINLGILADMVTEASSELKDKWGQWAYGITAFQQMKEQEPQLFDLTVDGKEYSRQAIALTVTNAGNIGKKGFSFLPDISVSDGLLDVISLDKADFASLLKITGSMLFQTGSEVLNHWKAKEIIIEMKQDHMFLCDDTSQTAQKLHIRVAPKSIKMCVPG